ncbi:FtsK/SpoIIIE domain-containing protein [Streptomyces sp. H39-S7]|uniref:FtsK/SpoIIIE domain-containing protein n=1 Tax=Streptomyces sp. H39-S7 TaxID=3004357 RepID=UPI0022AF4BB8|nr:FtsK/SpoIIIE domain-containing protein [Streptomyces sp. H39-S7]MCZ4122379.1 FtsK/SpoIIIE domain-containing protein [Streptomyces sp. H39-S7]
MDWKQAWSNTTTTTNTALDALAPMCAPFAVRWDRDAERRTQLRTPEHLKALMSAQREHNSARSTAVMARNQRSAARKATNNPLSQNRRAARTAHKAARQHHSQARAVLKAAQNNYPATLTTRAVQAHAAHAVPGGLASWLMSETAHTLTVWPASLSAGLIVLNAAGLWLGRRQPSVRLDDGMSPEERRLASRLDPSFWVQNADARGLSGTVPTPAKLTQAGLVAHVRLDGRWTPKSFRAKADEIRALLGARTALRMEITSGSHGDRATITLRTRSAADGIDLTGWAPGAPWGIDTITGDPVMVPLGRRMLIAGTSGSGKSWSTRALLADASEPADHRLIVIDPKRVEALNWQHRARTAVRRDDVLEVTDELVEEMHERLEEIPRGSDVIAISARRPRITVFVDEGAEVIAMARHKAPRTEDGPGTDYVRIMENLRTLARMARAGEIILIWATQKPTMDGKSPGLDPQISAQITYRASLALSTSSESRVVFGEDATEDGWHAHKLPMPGIAMLRSGPKSQPHPVKTRAFSPADVIALPDRPIWHRTATSQPTRSPLHLVKEPTTAPAAAPVPASNRDRVRQAVADGARTLRDITDRTGINKGTVSRELKALIATGTLLRTDDGMVLPGQQAA